MKFGKILKAKLNQDVLMGVVIGVMLVFLACFMGYCFHPKSMMEGMENNDLTKDEQIDKLQHQYFDCAKDKMINECAVINSQNACNSQSYEHNKKTYSCKWDTTDNKCSFSQSDLTFDEWINKPSKNGSLTPASTDSSSSTPSS